MGIFSRKTKSGAPVSVKSGAVELVVGSEIGLDEVRSVVSAARNLPPEKLWETQHNVRTVVDFLARNVAQLGLHVFERSADGGRVRVRDSVVTKVLSAPNAQQTGYELIEALVSDYALYNEAWWWVRKTGDGFEIIPLPVRDVSHASGREMFGDLVVWFTRNGKMTAIKQKDLIHFRGWHPSYTVKTSPAVTALRDVLAEQIAAQAFRVKVWENGGQVAQYVQRPADAGDWSEAAQAGFREAIKSWRSGGGAEGTMPIIADGMEIKNARINAKDEQWAEAQQLALETCARAWHVNPAMLGATGGVSYANVKEFRKMLYGETLGPILEMIQDRLNRFLLPLVGAGDGQYVEFNIKQKLASSFEEQAAVMSSAVGRPWLTADEARALENMPALGGDAGALVTPLNVLVGGQSSPRDSGTQNLRSAAAPLVKAEPLLRLKAVGRVEDEKTCQLVLQRFFKRQREVVLSRLGAKSPNWWDSERWDQELADDLFKASATVATGFAHETLEALGLDAGEYDVARTLGFLKSVAAKRAKWINETTLTQLEAALNDDLGEDSDKSTPEGVFAEAESTRSEAAGVTLATTLAGFAATEVGKQLNRQGTTKTWLTTSGNPRPSHAAMHGETVPVQDAFSNGMDWVGDMLGAGGEAGEIANCSCVTELTIY